MDRNHNDLKHDAFLYDIPVRIINYDRKSGEVSYSVNGSDLVYTCYDYELHSIDGGGIESMRILLNRLPENYDEDSKNSD
jgi:hypothetical protein